MVGRLCRQANCVFQVLAALHCETKCAKPLEDVTQLNICLVKYVWFFFFSNVNLKVVSVCVKAGLVCGSSADPPPWLFLKCLWLERGRRKTKQGNTSKTMVNISLHHFSSRNKDTQVLGSP